MADYDVIVFNVAAFIAGLFILESAADRFLDHTAKVASRLNVPATLIGLLTAGAEWEEVCQLCIHFHVPCLLSSEVSRRQQR